MSPDVPGRPRSQSFGETERSIELGRQVGMSAYQLGLMAPQRIEAFRREADAYRLMQVPREPRATGPTMPARLLATVRLLARRIVPVT